MTDTSDYPECEECSDNLHKTLMCDTCGAWLCYDCWIDHWCNLDG